MPFRTRARLAPRYLTADIAISMPPIPLEYEGLDAVRAFFVSIGRDGRRYDVVPTRANGQPAFGAYLRDPTSRVRHATGLDVLTIAGDRISALTHFEKSVFPSFGLPRALPPG